MEKEYYVSYSGGTTVTATSEDEACEIALDKLSIDDINAYEVDSEGQIIS